MTDQPADPGPTDSWEGILAALRRRYPNQKDSVLFCIHKLQQDRDLTLRDFRQEAALHGIPMAGRALHSARVLLGFQSPDRPRPKPTDGAAESAAEVAANAPARHAAPGRRARRRRERDERHDDSIEQQVVAAMQNIRSAADADAERMRTAIRSAIALLQRALDS